MSKMDVCLNIYSSPKLKVREFMLRVCLTIYNHYNIRGNPWKYTFAIKTDAYEDFYNFERKLLT